MKTAFTPDQLANSDIVVCDEALRRCVHCGFCTSSCPTYVLDGNELDSPRGRIMLIQNMLEKGGAPGPETVVHIDRCLSCLSCTTHCPSGVNYARLIDQAREHIETHYTRPSGERLLRRGLGWAMSDRRIFGALIGLARLGKPFAFLLPQRMRAMLALLPKPARAAETRAAVIPAYGKRKVRVGILRGCVQDPLDPAITDAAIRVLTKLGAEIVLPPDAGCCGALTHHLGQRTRARGYAQRVVEAFSAEIAGQGLDHIVVTSSGCGTMIKDYGHLFRDDPDLAAPASEVARRAADITEVVAGLDDGRLRAPKRLRVAYQSACSMQHGQKLDALPRDLLARAGFEVVEPAESHLCCGSAGVYNLLQPDISARLRARKAEALTGLGADVVASGNLGCMVQLRSAVDVPLVHTVQLLDWALDGSAPNGAK